MVKKIIHLSIVILAFCFLCVFASDNSSALTYSSNVDVGFTFNPTISVNLSGDLLINNLAPGSTSDSNIINVTIATNASAGYVLTATSGTKTTNTDLVNQSNSAYKFSSIATNASLASLTTDNTWGFSYSSDNGSNWSNYSGLPLDNDDEGATGKQLLSTTTPLGNKTIQFKIGAKAASSQAAGTYMNTINFYAVANPDPTLQPVSCAAGKICYNANSLTTVQGEMGQQTPSRAKDWSACTGGTDYETNCYDSNYHQIDINTLPELSYYNAKLWAPNFKREGYGFAGWSDDVYGNGHKYGPNQYIDAPSETETEGYALYAIWLSPTGNMQNWAGCSSMSQGEVTALTDARDNNVYAIAKLADGKCWMIENLRLDDSVTLSSTNTNNPSLPLTILSGTFSDHLSPTTNPYQNAWCDQQVSSCIDKSMLNTNNTTLFTNNSATNYDIGSDVYSYGNYYNFYSASVGHGEYSKTSGTIAGDICPFGWRIPTGDLNGEYYNLNDIINNGAADLDATNILRSYPINFISSGAAEVNRIRYRGNGGVEDSWGGGGVYWASTVSDSVRANNFTFSNSWMTAVSTYQKYYGLSIRCITGT